MQDIIARLRQWKVDYRPPATTAQLGALLEVARHPLPEELLQIYADHDGSDDRFAKDGTYLPVRLMPAEEAALHTTEAREMLADYEHVASAGEFIALWTDDNGNYVGAYVNGPLRGWLFVLDHDQPDLSPAYRSVRSFLTHLIDSMRPDRRRPPCDACTIPEELPVTEDAEEHLDDDWALCEYFIAAMATDTEEKVRQLNAFTGLRLLPVSGTGRCVAFLSDPDEWIARRAVELIEKRKYEATIPQLGDLVERAEGAGAQAARWALLRWEDNAEAKQELERLKQTLPPEKAELLWPPPWWKVWLRDWRRSYENYLACVRLMWRIRRHGLACPHCGRDSRDYRLSRGAGPTCVICRICGWPVDIEAAKQG